MRTLTSHKVNGLNESLTILASDGVGQGGACYEYEILLKATDGHNMRWYLVFQNGPISDSGFNGISNESLLAVIEDRLIGFQSGQFACRENDIALAKIQEAMMWLQKRTRDRMSRGVEGTNEK